VCLCVGDGELDLGTPWVNNTVRKGEKEEEKEDEEEEEEEGEGGKGRKKKRKEKSHVGTAAERRAK
jgi:hypothetical protein